MKRAGGASGFGLVSSFRVELRVMVGAVLLVFSVQLLV